ncbi:hypothetical protein CWE13_08785 [Aliidiomarina shirensis]|uniref:Uncharacterized protein n=2 Tax=Aliidiomarina shirensis TaxID=1048642 RepID=A0A432WT29_9GAMM|nr:hypothetical protein CWE13_08785 [Aliidiomarina shirensis]
MQRICAYLAEQLHRVSLNTTDLTMQCKVMIIVYDYRKQREPKFMPYCHTAFQNVPPDQVEEILSTLTKEQFIGGRAAYILDDGSYSIDAGQNDIRAIYYAEESTIKFFCRYEREIAFYDKKLKFFAENHSIHTTL